MKFKNTMNLLFLLVKYKPYSCDHYLALSIVPKLYCIILDCYVFSLQQLDVGGSLSPGYPVHRKKFKRYKNSLKGAIPIRFEKR
jgi:hypothetical protein